MKNIKKINIIYILPAHKSASGGSKVIYQHSELINKFKIENISSHILHLKKKKIGKIFLKHDYIDKNRKYKKKEIEAKTLNDVLKNSKYNGQQIDFLNIDVQGYDYKVLKSLDFKVYKPKYICIEIQFINENEIMDFLAYNKYQKIWTGINSNIFEKKE